MIRITAGMYRGRRVFTSGVKARPAVSIVREAVFNILRSYINIEGTNVCDLFSGSGSFSFEALSRGAKHVCAVDIYEPNLRLVKRTAVSLGVDSRISLLCCDVRRLTFVERQYDIVFVDPPYSEPVLAETALNVLHEQQLCSSDGVVVLRIRKDEKIEVHQRYKLLNMRQYGCSKLLFMQPQKVAAHQEGVLT